MIISEVSLNQLTDKLTSRICAWKATGVTRPARDEAMDYIEYVMSELRANTHILVSDSENQAFGIEALAVRNMMKNHKLAGAIADAGWYQFRSFLTYKAAAVGKQVIEVGRFYPSSKTCSACGIVRESLAMSEKKWTCECGVAHQRDINAARNIALEALRNSARRGRASL